MTFLARRRRIEPTRTLIMGILNINDDSFSGDGSLDQAWAARQAAALIAAGADLVDVGAESARTNRLPVSEDEEIRRLQPFLEAWDSISRSASPRDPDQIYPPLLSINTWRPAVAAPALALAGDLLNDMGGLPTPENALLCASSGAALLIMHTVGLPKQDHSHVRYDNVIDEICRFLLEKKQVALDAGVGELSILFDPGLGFAKQPEHDLEIMAHLGKLASLGHPLLVPVSRKGFLGKVVGRGEADTLDAATVAASVVAMERGAAILRVHNVNAAYLARSVRQSVRHTACRL